jgi:hypothetical protein
MICKNPIDYIRKAQDDLQPYRISNSGLATKGQFSVNPFCASSLLLHHFFLFSIDIGTAPPATHILHNERIKTLWQQDWIDM